MTFSGPPAHWPPPQPPAIPLKKATPFLPLFALFLTLGGLVSGLNYLILGLTLPAATLIATVIALIPLAMLSWYYAWLDSGEPEGRKMFIAAFLWGSVGATGFALIANGVSVALLGTFVGVAIFAPFIEEVLKGVFIFALFWWRRHRFNGPLDGIVYAGFIGMGFAFVENITYFTAAYSGMNLLEDVPQEGGAGVLFGTFIARGLLTLFAHPLFTAMTGIGLGLASLKHTRRDRVFYSLAGLAAAILLHGLWNGMLTAAPIGVVLLVYVLFFIPLFVLYLLYARRERARVQQSMELALTDLARLGFLPQRELEWLADRAHRKTALALAKAWGGPAAGEAMRVYQQYALRFASLHLRVRAQHAPEDYQATGQRYAQTLAALRPRVLFPQPPRPTYWAYPPPLH